MVRIVIYQSCSTAIQSNIPSVFWIQILGDPEAADLVFGCGAPIKVIGLDVTRNILMTGRQATRAILRPAEAS